MQSECSRTSKFYSKFCFVLYLCTFSFFLLSFICCLLLSYCHCLFYPYDQHVDLHGAMFIFQSFCCAKYSVKGFSVNSSFQSHTLIPATVLCTNDLYQSVVLNLGVMSHGLLKTEHFVHLSAKFWSDHWDVLLKKFSLKILDTISILKYL